MAESKMVMHQEIINKDEEISKLRSSLKKVKEEGDKLKEEVDSLKKAQVNNSNMQQITMGIQLSEKSSIQTVKVYTLIIEWSVS